MVTASTSNHRVTASTSKKSNSSSGFGIAYFRTKRQIQINMCFEAVAPIAAEKQRICICYTERVFHIAIPSPVESWKPTGLYYEWGIGVVKNAEAWPSKKLSCPGTWKRHSDQLFWGASKHRLFFRVEPLKTVVKSYQCHIMDHPIVFPLDIKLGYHNAIFLFFGVHIFMGVPLKINLHQSP